MEILGAGFQEEVKHGLEEPRHSPELGFSPESVSFEEAPRGKDFLAERQIFASLNRARFSIKAEFIPQFWQAEEISRLIK